MNYDDDKIVEALNGPSTKAHDDRVLGALNGDEYLYGLPDLGSEDDDAVRVWATKESLKGAAERYARAGAKPLDDATMETVVAEVWGQTNPGWTPIDRMERTAHLLSRLAAHNERIGKGKAGMAESRPTSTKSIREAGK